jgi:hypothetical protein
VPLAGSPHPFDGDETLNTPPAARFGLAVGSISVTSGVARGAPDWLPPPLLAASAVTDVNVVGGPGGGPSGNELTTPVEEATSLVGLAA